MVKLEKILVIVKADFQTAGLLEKSTVNRHGPGKIKLIPGIGCTSRAGSD